MKHSLRITFLLIGMFFVAQLIGLFVISSHLPEQMQIVDATGNITNVTSYNLPYGLDPPAEVQPRSVKEVVISFAVIFAVAILLMFLLMKFNATILIRLWFFFVVTLAIGVAVSSLFIKLGLFTNEFFVLLLGPVKLSSLISLAIALPLSYFKVYKRNILVHNVTELVIYPGIAAIFVAMILSWTTSSLLTISVVLILISIYDMYAVWHAGFMQKMAHYQIKNIKIFTGFFVPYLGKKEQAMVQNAKQSNLKKSSKKIRVNVAILGGGDVVFPLILSGIVMFNLGLAQALIVTLGATISLAVLFYLSEKGKSYPAMPFLTLGCFIGLLASYLI